MPLSNCLLSLRNGQFSKLYVNKAHFISVYKNKSHSVYHILVEVYFKSEKVLTSVHSWTISGLGPFGASSLLFSGMDRNSDSLNHIYKLYIIQTFCVFKLKDYDVILVTSIMEQTPGKTNVSENVANVSCNLRNLWSWNDNSCRDLRYRRVILLLVLQTRW